MKTILIATDFSEAAHNAALYGTKLAKSFHARVIVYNVFHIPIPVPESVLVFSPEEIKEGAMAELMAEEARINPAKEVAIELLAEEGIPALSIIQKANDLKADMIVVGMKENNRLQKIFGSVATALAEKSNIPVIIVPEGVQYIKPDTIVFASDIVPDINIHSIDMLKDISYLFKSKLYLVRVVKQESQVWYEVMNVPETLKSAVRRIDASYEYPVDKDITHALNSFVETHRATMLAMMPHRHNWMGRIFKKSETKKMIFHSHIALLLLPERKLASFNERPAKQAAGIKSTN